MALDRSSTGGGATYEIVLGKRISGRWATTFDGFDLLQIPGDGTLLRGHVPDQAALHGILARVRDLGIPLIAVRRVEILGDEREPSEEPERA